MTKSSHRNEAREAEGVMLLAHFECVVIAEAQEWTANPGRRPS